MKTSEIQTEENKSLIDEYRAFEEFAELSDEQIIEINELLKIYAELVYRSFSHQRPHQSGKVIQLNSNEVLIKAA